MYARGILFGKMKYELGDHSFVRCPENHLTADIEFKTKGYFGGTYNAIGGVIKNDQTGEVLYELSGMWNGEMYAKHIVVSNSPLVRKLHYSLMNRPVKKNSSSMRLLQDTPHRQFGPWMNKRSANPRNYGVRLWLPSKNQITMPPQTRSPE